jgi:hypothetical protein
MRRLLAVTLASLSLVAAGTAAAGNGGGGGGVPQFPRVPGNWTHVEINITIRHTPHTVILDRGRIVQASAVQITLRERDGSTAVIPLSDQTIITQGTGNRPATGLRRGMTVMTMRIDGGPAVRVRILLGA